MQNTKKTRLDYTVEALKADNGGSVGSTALPYETAVNAMESTAEKAPYLIRPVMGETMEFDEFAAEMLKEAGQGTLTEAKYYANVFNELVERLLADGRTSVDTGWFTAAPAISGSVPYCNAPLGEGNEIHIAMLPCPDTRKLVAMMDTASCASGRAFDIREVFDVATNTPGVVSGAAFYVFGQSFSEDMAAALVGADGVERPCTSPVVNRIPTRLTFTAPAGLAAGKYTLVLTGVGSGEVAVTQKKRNVPVRAAQTPPEDPVRFDTIEIVRNDYGVDTALTGAGLDQIEGYSRESGNGKFTATVYVNGTESGEVDFTEGSDEIYQANLNELGLEVGDTVKIEAPVASAPGRVQTKVEGEATVEEA